MLKTGCLKSGTKCKIPSDLIYFGANGELYKRSLSGKITQLSHKINKDSKLGE